MGANKARDGCGARKLVSIGTTFHFLTLISALISALIPSTSRPFYCPFHLYSLPSTLTNARWFGELEFEALAFEILRFEAQKLKL
jgi:hypothetical protein